MDKAQKTNQPKPSKTEQKKSGAKPPRKPSKFDKWIKKGLDFDPTKK
jgi:hypothetical protein